MTTATENQNTTPADEVEEEAKAEELFAEAAAAREGSSSDGSDDANAQAGAASGADDGSQGKDTTAGGGDAVASQSGGSEGGAATAATSGEGDIWANVPPEARAAYEAAVEEAKQAEHKFKSREGRERALQRQLEELRRTGGQEEPERKPLKDLLKKETVEELGTEYPDLKPILEALSATVERLDGVEQQVGEARSSAVAAATAPEEMALTQAIPDWKANVQADPDKFLEWVDDQPRRVREIVQANWAGITNAKEAAEVFESYGKFLNPPKDEGAAGGGGSGKRERQQSGARAATVTAPTSAQGESDDADVAFAQAAALKDRAKGLRT